MIQINKFAKNGLKSVKNRNRYDFSENQCNVFGEEPVVKTRFLCIRSVYGKVQYTNAVFGQAQYLSKRSLYPSPVFQAQCTNTVCKRGCASTVFFQVQFFSKHCIFFLAQFLYKPSFCTTAVYWRMQYFCKVGSPSAV